MLNRVEALLRRAKEKPCTYSEFVDGFAIVCIGGRLSVDGQLHAPHDLCHGTGTITDPKFQAALDVIAPIQYVIPPIDGWPDGAVRGLLEQVVEQLELDSPFTLGSNGVWVGETGKNLRFAWCGDVPSLGKAIMEALNEYNLHGD